MSRLPHISGKALVQALRKDGFVVKRIRGSHFLLQHADGRRAVVPVHGREEIGPGLLLKILRDCDLDRDQLRGLL